MGDGSIFQQVAVAKDDHLADGALHAHRIIVAAKIFLPPARGNGSYLLRGIFGMAGGGEGGFILIGGIDLDVVLAQLISEMLSQKNGHRISLFAGGAAGAPHAEGIGLAAMAGKAGQNLLAQDVPSRRITEEAGDVDQNGGEKLVYFLRTFANEFKVPLVIVELDLGHAAGDAPRQSGAFVSAQVQPALFRQRLQQRFQARVFRQALWFPQHSLSSV